MQRKFLSTKEFQSGLSSLLKTATYNTKVATSPTFIDAETCKYKIPEAENTDLGTISDESVPFFSNIFNRDPN
jgi:hypothetical protein